MKSKTLRFGLVCFSLTLCLVVSVAAPPKLVSSIQTPAPPKENSGTSIRRIDTLKIPVLDFKNTDISDILRVLGRKYDINLWLSPEVKGKVSLHLVNLPVRRALEFIVKKYGFELKEERGVFQVTKAKERLPEVKKAPINMRMYAGKVDVDTKDAEIDTFVRLFSNKTSINIVLEKGTTGKISANLKTLEPAKALKIIMESNGFDLDVSNGIYYVSKAGWAGPAPSAAGPRRPGMPTPRRPGLGRRIKRSAVSVEKDKVTLQVTGASLNDIVREISNQSSIDIFIYGQVDGQISARCKELSIDEALRYLLQNTKYTFWKNAGIYFIGDKESGGLNASELITVNYIKADDVVELLPKRITTAANIKVVKEQNGVMIIGPYDIIANARDFIRQIDLPVAQILLEAVVIDFSVDKLRDYGLRLFTYAGGDTTRFEETFFPDIQARAGGRKIGEKLTDFLRTIGSNQIVELPKDFMAQVNAMENAGVAKVRSTPQIATLNGNKASISVGSTQYYLLKKNVIHPGSQDGRVVSEQEEFKTVEANVILTMTPWVTANREVTVEIKPEFNIPKGGFIPGQPPTIDKRVIESTVRLKDGQTIILGGLRETKSEIQENKVPILGSIPVLGWLFKNRRTVEKESQLMIFLTPHIYYGDEGAVEIDDVMGKNWLHEVEPPQGDTTETQ